MNDVKKKTDRRVVKTRKAIRNAFAELLSEKDIDEITIKDISDAADINRKTFYNYYSGVYQLIDEIEDEIVLAFESVLKDVYFKRDMGNPYRIFENLTAIINSDIDFYGYLMKMDSNANLISKIISALKNKLKSSFSSQIEIEEQKIDLIANYVVSGMLAIYQNWFNSDRSQSIEELSNDVSIMAFSGINGMLKKQDKTLRKL